MAPKQQRNTAGSSSWSLYVDHLHELHSPGIPENPILTAPRLLTPMSLPFCSESHQARCTRTNSSRSNASSKRWRSFNASIRKLTPKRHPLQCFALRNVQSTSTSSLPRTTKSSLHPSPHALVSVYKKIGAGPHTSGTSHGSAMQISPRCDDCEELEFLSRDSTTPTDRSSSRSCAMH